jgi:hypothetical protein
MKRTVSVALAVASVMAGSAWADPAPQTLHACAVMKDSSERLACFDRAMAETPAAAQSPAQQAGKAPSTSNTAAGAAPQAAAVVPPAPAAAVKAAPVPGGAPASGANSAYSSNLASSPQSSVAVGSAQAPGAAGSAQSSATASAAQSSTAQFGEENLPRAGRPAEARKETALLSSITAMRVVRPEVYAIALKNGQVWRQEEATQISLFFRVGDEVRIEKAALGSYHMSTASTGSKNWVRVTRIQ